MTLTALIASRHPLGSQGYSGNRVEGVTLHYVRELAVAALADGLLERHEVEDLRAVADLLSVDRDLVFADLVELEADHLSH